MRTNNDTACEPTLGNLQKLLALKRYEIPPPGYFGTFPSKVIARIEAGESVEAVSWWSRFLLALSTRPSLASGLALIVGLSVLGAMGVAPAVRSGSLEGDLMLGSAPVAVQAAMMEWSADEASSASVHPHLGASSVAPVLASEGGGLTGFAMRPASYRMAD
jgi:hypothetical protein